MDVYQEYILVTYRPFDVHIFNVKLFGELTPSGNPDLQLSAARELSIMTAKSHPAAMRFIPDQIPREPISKSYISSSSYSFSGEPARCLILRSNGELSLLDLDDGRERNLTDSVELFWVTCGHFEDKTNLIEEALRLAELSAEKPHFSHCLEWLLFTVFEADISRPNVDKNQMSVLKHVKNSFGEDLRSYPKFSRVLGCCC